MISCCRKLSLLQALSSFVEMEKVVGKRCPMCNNQKGMGAPPKPKPKVVFGKVEGEKGNKRKKMSEMYMREAMYYTSKGLHSASAHNLTLGEELIS